MPRSIREAYGDALVRFGKDHPDVVVLDADVSASTKTGAFGKAFPDRFFSVGIAEANMAAMAGGLASVGKIPFVNTFAVFVTTNSLLSARTFGSYAQLPLKLAGAYSGMSDAFDGPSHHSVEDIAIMRALPNYKIFVPCDEYQTEWVVRHAMESPSPMYLRLSRDVFPAVYTANETFEEGRGRIVRDGCDAAVIACGLMVGNALKAAEELEKEKISLRVVDMFCIKPLDEALILRCAKETKAIVSAEEHNVIGGLGGAVAEVLCRNQANVPMGFVGIQDRHGECGPYARLQEKYGFDSGAIVRKVKEILSSPSPAADKGESS